MVESFSLNPFEEQNGEGDAESTRSGRADFSDIGRVVEVSGGSSSIRLDGRALKQLDGHQDITVAMRSEEHTSELQSLMRISYAVFCLKKKNTAQHYNLTYTYHSTA